MAKKMTNRELLTLVDGLAEDAARDHDAPVGDVEVHESVVAAARRETGLRALFLKIEVALLGNGHGLRTLRQSLVAVEHEARTVAAMAEGLRARSAEVAK